MAKLQSVEEVVRSLAQCVQGIITENDKRVIKIYDTNDAEKKQLNEAAIYLTEMQSRFNAQQKAWEGELKSLTVVGHERSEANLKLKS